MEFYLKGKNANIEVKELCVTYIKLCVNYAKFNRDI